MPILDNYTQFDGYYWQTSVIRNALDYQGIVAPHTNQPYTEALLFGVSGGMNFGYFYFHYDGYDPMLNILTRNTFNLFEPILQRMGIPYEFHRTASADKGRKNLISIIENGEVPIVEADTSLLTFYAEDYDENNWMTQPVIVYGYDETTAYIANRARVGLEIPASDLDKARARIKKDKHQITTLGIPDEAKLASAVASGIWDCIKLFTEKPPRGSSKNFGFNAYQNWITLLTKPTAKGSWAKTFPQGRELYSGLTTGFYFSQLFGKDESCTAERNMMADFIAEASIILDKPQLNELIPQLLEAGQAWQQLGQVMLPDDVPLLKESREILMKKHQLFLTQGHASTDQRRELYLREQELLRESENLPLSDDEVGQLQANIADHVQQVHDIEYKVIDTLRQMMS